MVTLSGDQREMRTVSVESNQLAELDALRARPKAIRKDPKKSRSGRIHVRRQIERDSDSITEVDALDDMCLELYPLSGFISRDRNRGGW